MIDTMIVSMHQLNTRSVIRSIHQSQSISDELATEKMIAGLKIYVRFSVRVPYIMYVIRSSNEICLTDLVKFRKIFNSVIC